MGPVVKDDKEAPAGMIKVKIPPRIYAIVSVDIQGNGKADRKRQMKNIILRKYGVAYKRCKSTKC